MIERQLHKFYSQRTIVRNKLSIDSELAATSPVIRGSKPSLLPSIWSGSRAIQSGYRRFIVVMAYIQSFLFVQIIYSFVSASFFMPDGEGEEGGGNGHAPRSTPDETKNKDTHSL